MRPLKLEIQGFTAFRDLQTVPFDDLDLFTITGPTGAGKTSLLDAMLYALYGKVPRMGGQGLSDLISHGVAQARIQLDFSVNGTGYRVARRLSRGGANSATFERFDGEGWVTDVEGSGVKAVTKRIEGLIKLDFEAFTRAVVLPQGEFQRFLRGDRDERRDVLTDLLGLKHFLAMGVRARARARELEVSVEATSKILEDQYADATPERLKELSSSYKTAEKRAVGLVKAVKLANELDAKAGGLRAARETLQRQSDEIDLIRSTLDGALDACHDARDREDAANAAIATAKTRCDKTRAEVDALQAKLDQLVKEHGSLEELARAQGALEASRQAASELQDAKAESAKRSSSLEGTATAKKTASLAAQHAEDEFQSVTRAEMAASLAAQLSAGDPCPVCHRVLDAAPEVDQHIAETIAEAKQRLVEARKRAQDASNEHASAKTADDEARRRIKRSEKAMETAAREIERIQSLRRWASQAKSGAVPSDAAKELGKRRQAVMAAEKAVSPSRQTADAAQKALQNATQAIGDLRVELSELDAQLAGLRVRCETAHRVIADSIKGSASTVKLERLPRAVLARETRTADLRAWCIGAEGTISASDADCKNSLNKFEARIVKLAADHDVEVSDGAIPTLALKHAEEDARDARVRCEEAIRQAEQRLAQRERLTASIADSEAEIHVLTLLTAELRADRFVQFIIQQTLDLLAIRASEQLMRISSDRYSLISDEGEFFVVDHVNADERRSVKTLSGGETFLASLSLALALSQHVGELATEGLGAKLEAVFIDEGFGQLDPETLEDVIDALERLREGNLMVGVITHVPLLAERIRVGVRVEKHENHSNVIATPA